MTVRNSRKNKGIARYKHKVAGPCAAWIMARTSASAGSKPWRDTGETLVSAGSKPWCRGAHAQNWGCGVGRAASGPSKVRKYDKRGQALRWKPRALGKPEEAPGSRPAKRSRVVVEDRVWLCGGVLV